MDVAGVMEFLLPGTHWEMIVQGVFKVLLIEG